MNRWHHRMASTLLILCFLQEQGGHFCSSVGFLMVVFFVCYTVVLSFVISETQWEANVNGCCHLRSHGMFVSTDNFHGINSIADTFIRAP